MVGASGVTVQLFSSFIDGGYVGELVEAIRRLTES